MSSAAVSPAVAPVAQIFKINNNMVDRTLDGLSDQELWQRTTGGNPIAWILGHITETRGALLTQLGTPWKPGWEKQFARGSMLGEASAYPSPVAIADAWKETRKLMRDAFAGLTDEQLLQRPPGPTIAGAETVSDLITFLAFHESYHIGQMAYVRRALGHSGIAG